MGDNTVAWVLLIIGLVALIWFVNWIGHRAGDKVQDAIEHKINKSQNEKTAGGWQSLAEKYGYKVDGKSERAPVQPSAQMLNQGNMQPRFCSKCGAKLEGVENFCGKCGAKVVGQKLKTD